MRILGIISTFYFHWRGSDLTKKNSIWKTTSRRGCCDLSATSTGLLRHEHITAAFLLLKKVGMPTGCQPVTVWFSVVLEVRSLETSGLWLSKLPGSETETSKHPRRSLATFQCH